MFCAIGTWCLQHILDLFIFSLHRDRVSRPTSVFDRNGFDPFARGRRNSLSKKSKMKQIKQPAAPSIVKQADYSQVCYHVIANLYSGYKFPFSSWDVWYKVVELYTEEKFRDVIHCSSCVVCLTWVNNFSAGCRNSRMVDPWRLGVITGLWL